MFVTSFPFPYWIYVSIVSCYVNNNKIALSFNLVILQPQNNPEKSDSYVNR